ARTTDGTYRVEISPAIGTHGRKRLTGCLADSTLDRVPGPVESVTAGCPHADGAVAPVGPPGQGAGCPTGSEGPCKLLAPGPTSRWTTRPVARRSLGGRPQAAPGWSAAPVEAGDDLDVGRVREGVHQGGRHRLVARLGQQPDVAPERAGVAAHEHDPPGAGGGDHPDPGVPQPGPGRVGDDDVRAP